MEEDAVTQCVRRFGVPKPEGQRGEVRVRLLLKLRSGEQYLLTLPCFPSAHQPRRRDQAVADERSRLARFVFGRRHLPLRHGRRSCSCTDCSGCRQECEQKWQEGEGR